MPITVRQLSENPDFRITIRSGHEHAERELSWAHVSELDDPTAFLSGGELLLTTGMSLPESAAEIENHVRRLVAAGVAAVGFGTGLRYETVPEPFLRAAQDERLPLLEVPLEVPFILLEKAVSQALSADDHARLQLGHQHQRRLIHATLAADGAATLVRRTAELIGGWAARLDSAGRVIDTSHRAAHRAVTKITIARTARPSDVVFATEGGEDIISQPLTATDGSVLGYLVAGRKGVIGSLDHGAVAVAASLLTLFVRRSEQAHRALSRTRTAATKMLFAGEVAGAHLIADELWGGLPQAPVQVITACGPQTARATALQLFDAYPDGSAAFGAVEDRVSIIATHSAVGECLARLASVPGLNTGISTAADWAELPRAERESRRAAEHAAEFGRPTHFADITTSGLTTFIDHGRARSYAEQHLRPLGDGGSETSPLLDTLRVWLAHNGHIDPAAQLLGIHRHTLRRRLDRIATLLGTSLESPTIRAELWLELTLLGYTSDNRA